MKILPPMIALLALLSFSALPVFGQKLVCACESQKGTKDPCSKVECSDGCTTLCAPNFNCFSSCRKEGLEKQFSIKLEKKSGNDIVSALSDETGYKIRFKAHKPYRNLRYDLDVKNDDVFNVLNFLSRRGSVKINDIPFVDFQWNRVQEKGGKTVPSNPE